MSSIDLLLDRNRDFARARFPGPLALMPRLRATVVGCLPDKAVGDPHASLAVDVEVLRQHPGIATAYRVTGLCYDVQTGLIEQVVPDRTASA